MSRKHSASPGPTTAADDKLKPATATTQDSKPNIPKRRCKTSGARRWLEIEELKKQPDGSWAFRKPEARVTCDEKQMAILQSFLNAQYPENGSYTLMTGPEAALTVLLQQANDGQIDAAALGRLLSAVTHAGMAEVAEALADANADGLLAGMMERRRQKNQLSKVRAIAEDADSGEEDLQKELARNWWIFGGRYIGVGQQRQLIKLDQYDIPLVRADGSLHIVELKKAKVSPLTTVEHSHHRVDGNINEAVCQAMNYLRALDEQRDHILANYKVEARRASATVVIGHPLHAKLDEAQINETLRIYNSHLSRVEVITYKQLIDGAEQSLALSAGDGPHGEQETDEVPRATALAA